MGTASTEYEVGDVEGRGAVLAVVYLMHGPASLKSGPAAERVRDLPFWKSQMLTIPRQVCDFIAVLPYNRV
jgi:hypothetical protein